MGITPIFNHVLTMIQASKIPAHGMMRACMSPSLYRELPDFLR